MWRQHHRHLDKFDKVLADIAAYWPPNWMCNSLDFSYILKEQVFVKFQLMISSFSQEQFQQFYEFSGGGGGGDNRKVP